MANKENICTVCGKEKIIKYKGTYICNYCRKKAGYKEILPYRYDKRKIRSIGLINYGIRKGEIVKSKFCSICNKTNCIIDGHHEDYSKPLEVIWCCKQCHTILDRERRNISKVVLN